MSNYREDGLPPKAPKGRRVAERDCVPQLCTLNALRCQTVLKVAAAAKGLFGTVSNLRPANCVAAADLAAAASKEN